MTDQNAVMKQLEECLSASCRGFRTCPYDKEWDAVKAAYDLLKAHEPKKRESRAMLPCKCGGKQREHWYAPNNELREGLRCKKCGFTVAGKNQIDAIRRWNEAVKLDD